MNVFVDSFFKPELIASTTPLILRAMLVTIEIAALVVVTGLALGLALASLRSFRVRPINLLIVVYVDAFRALPPLVLVLLAFFGLPNVGVNLSSIAVLWLVLSLVLGAFAEEIFWAGILSVRRGQWEAARPPGSALPRRSPMWCCPRRSGSPSRRSPTAPSRSPRTPRSAA
jgi:polar amino acid transport system permease protein